ncbi:MAG: DUF2550 domain-containing protein [Actinobacteria bacterium]|nr:DUF2550 domain-containing protein [Actinomycetota bacterium]
MSKAIALDAAWIFAAFLIIAVFCAIGLAIRRMLLDRRGGTVACGLRRPGGAWRLGVAAYEKDELRWYVAVGVLLTPEEVLARQTLAVASRREPYPAETALLGPGMVVVSCTAGEEMPETVELAMGEAALTGFLAWLESAPPGSYPLNPLGADGASARFRVSTAHRLGWRWPCGPG